MKASKILYSLVIFSSFFIQCSPDPVEIDTSSVEDEVRPEKVYEGNVRLTSQEEIDNFGKEQYTKINGNLRISDYQNIGVSDDPILDLSPLSSLKSIEYDLIFSRNLLLTNTEGLQNLEKVKRISFYENFRLKTIDDLEKITTTNELSIKKNYELIDISSLRNLSNINLNLELNENYSLTSLNGLHNLNFVGQDIIIEENIELLSLKELNNILRVRYLSIRNNEKISNLDGFNQLTEVQHIVIAGNDNLISIKHIDKLITVSTISISNNKLESYEGFHNITSLKNLFIYGSNGTVRNFEGFRNLSTIESDFLIEWNVPLNSLKGLEKLSNIGGTFEILATSITNLDGLENLTTINKNLIIRRNSRLLSIEGLQSLSTLENDLILEKNSALNTLTGLTISPNNNMIIQDNINLVDFCSLNVETINVDRYNVTGNSYNPNYQDLVDGNCTL